MHRHTHTHTPFPLRPFPLSSSSDCCIRTWLSFVFHIHAHTHMNAQGGGLGQLKPQYSGAQRSSSWPIRAMSGLAGSGGGRCSPPFVLVRVGLLNKQLHFQPLPRYCRPGSKAVLPQGKVQQPLATVWDCRLWSFLGFRGNPLLVCE